MGKLMVIEEDTCCHEGKPSLEIVHHNAEKSAFGKQLFC